MGKYVHKFDTIVEYNAVKYDLIRPQLVKVEDTQEICWKRAYIDQGIEWVDLGLPSDTLWAKYNLGYSSSNLYGDRYAWGELTSKGNDSANYTDANYRWAKTDTYTYEKYNPTDGKITLDLTDDVAHTTYGGQWRIPTIDDFHELTQNINITYSSNTSYYTLTSKINGKSIQFFSTGLNCWLNKDLISGLSSQQDEAYYIISDTAELSGKLYLDTISTKRYKGYFIRPVLKRK